MIEKMPRRVLAPPESTKIGDSLYMALLWPLSSAISTCNTLNGALRQGLPAPASRRLSPPVDGIQNRKGAAKDSTPEDTGCVAPRLSCERPRPTGELMLRRSTCLRFPRRE